MATLIKDIKLQDNIPNSILFEKHVEFIKEYGQDENNYEYGMTDYLRVSGMYWGLTALELMNTLPSQSKGQITLELSCRVYTKLPGSTSGGISACIGHDPHILHTLSAVQILCIYNNLEAIDVDGVVKCVASLQLPDGSFTGDKWGEVDTRFSFCAVATLSLLKRMDVIDVNKAVDFVASCKNFDGGFG
ncbi:hypothetical protein NQ318_003318 [Aromia moschata]|uniref:Geranylgeranyl transferase type II subunit beta n=1 Tax=Aromia moschata TaxID=1265417 RepID=A0AAV8YLT3_9CUCU|nr:hypothetical protein NQ318_003318 [Aromia moschata]